MNRVRTVSMVMQIVTVVVVLVLLVYSVVESQNLAADRQEQALQASERNRALLTSLDEIVRDIRKAQVNQRRAFRSLAQRNEQLHGRDPSEAPQFDALPPPRARASQGSGDPEEPDQPQRDPTRDPDPPSPSPSPLCIPVVNVCVGRND